MTYAEDPCDKCGKYLPRKDFHAWSEDVVVGRESGTHQRFASGAEGYKEGKTTYKRVTRRLCPECWAEREDVRLAAEAEREEERRLAAEAAAASARAAGRRALIMAGVVGIVLTALIGGALLLQSGPPSTNVAAPTNSAPSNELASTNAAPGSAPFPVSIDVSVTGDSRPVVTGTTNLPDGTILLVQLRKPLPDCDGSCVAFRPAGAKDTMEGGEVVVDGGRFAAGPSWSDAIDPTRDRGVPALPSSTYVLEVRSQLSIYQPPEVRTVIGDQGQNMQGPLVDACCLSKGPVDAAMAAREKAGIEQAEPLAGHQVYFAQLLTVADADQTSEEDSPSAPSPSADTEQRPAGTPLSIAVDQALDTGQPTPWRDGSDGGVVSVGQRTIWRGRFCRSYGFTTNGVRSPVMISCRAIDGRWQGADTYANATAPAGE